MGKVYEAFVLNNRSPREGSPGKGSNGIDPRDGTYAATLLTSRGDNCHAPGISGSIPWEITLASSASFEALLSLGRCKLGPRPPLPVCPWHKAHCDSKSLLPTTGSPAGSGD